MIDKAAQFLSASMHNRMGKIHIGNDVWIGEGVLIRRGVTIGNGAVLASRAVVTSDVAPYAIVGGIPAKIIRYRFEPSVIEALLELQWWEYGLEAVQNADFTNIVSALQIIKQNISNGAAPYVGSIMAIKTDRTTAEVGFDLASGEFYYL